MIEKLVELERAVAANGGLAARFRDAPAGAREKGTGSDSEAIALTARVVSNLPGSPEVTSC